MNWHFPSHIRVVMRLLERCLFIYFLLLSLQKTSGIMRRYDGNIHEKYYSPTPKIGVVSLTQKGYIQFLRYETHVPPLPEFTFCIWLRSKNLTYNQPVFSYSKNEEERIVRMWISSKGNMINLEILNYPLLELPMKFDVNRWYHICQSWSSYQARWNLFIDGKLKSTGAVPELQGVTIPSGGDIVVGQEYTDFDKGLDDGIEGDIFGFNLVLSATSSTKTGSTSQPFKAHYNENNPKTFDKRISYNALYNNPSQRLPFYSVSRPLRIKKSIFDEDIKKFEDELYFRQFHRFRDSNWSTRQELPLHSDKIRSKSVGLRLVELSSQCALGRGSPLSGKEVLISWTKTPVRVFGGALLKNILPFCT